MQPGKQTRLGDAGHRLRGVLYFSLVIALSCLVAPALIAAPNISEQGWTQVHDGDGIEVYRRLERESDLVEVLTRATVEAPVDKVLTVLRDHEHYPEFIPHIVESTVLSTNGNVQQIFQRVRISEFWRFMFADRYHVVDNRVIELADGIGHFRIEWSINDRATRKAKPGDAIATRANTGYWDLRATAEGRNTAVEYYLFTDPGGSIPKTFVNAGTTQSVPAVIEAIRKRVRLR